jgi:hypothetical protein
LYRHALSIYAREAHDSRCDCYVFVPTFEIVEGLRREGWFSFFAVQSVPRHGNRHASNRAAASTSKVFPLLWNY